MLNEKHVEYPTYEKLPRVKSLTLDVLVLRGEHEACIATATAEGVVLSCIVDEWWVKALKDSGKVANGNGGGGVVVGG